MVEHRFIRLHGGGFRNVDITFVSSVVESLPLVTWFIGFWNNVLDEQLVEDNDDEALLVDDDEDAEIIDGVSLFWLVLNPSFFVFEKINKIIKNIFDQYIKSVPKCLFHQTIKQMIPHGE